MRKKRYQIIAAPVCEPMARRLQAKYPERSVRVISVDYIYIHTRGSRPLDTHTHKSNPPQPTAHPPTKNSTHHPHDDSFRFHPTHWGKFPDGTDNIEVGGFQPHNVMAGEHVLLLASFHNNDVTLSQFQVCRVCL